MILRQKMQPEKTVDILGRHHWCPLEMTSELLLLLTNERRNSILMTRHYPDLCSVTDWLKICHNQSEELPSSGKCGVISMEFRILRSFLMHADVILRGHIITLTIKTQADNHMNQSDCEKNK